MELQEHLETFRDADVAVFSIGPDSVADLRAFADRHGITYPLLADEDSRVIRGFGILNTLIDPDEAEYGIPFPGMYLVERDGRVRHAWFHREYQVRETAATILAAGFGALPADLVPAAAPLHEPASVSVVLAATRLHYMQRADLLVRFRLAPGVHVYVPPIPDGYDPLTVSVRAPDGVRIGPANVPDGRPFRVDGLPELFHVIEGDAVVRVPLTVGLRSAPDRRSIPLDVEVRYQACTDRECFTPATHRVRLDVPLDDLALEVPAPPSG